MKKILFVDDEKELHPIITSYFPKEQYRVVCAFDGSEGMQKCRNENFDLVIMDFKIPKIDGAKFYLLLQDLQESKKAEMPPVIFVSGFLDELRARDIKWSRCEFLSKPFNKEDLLQKVQQVSERTKPHQLKAELKRVVKAGETLFREGDDDNCIYYVVSGLLELKKNDSNGNPVSIGKVGAGELVGEMSLLTDEKRLFSAVTLDDCEIIPIPSEKVLALVNSQPKWIKLMIESLSKKLKDSIKQIA